VDLFNGGENRGGRFPLTVLPRFRFACSRVSSGRATCGTTMVFERPRMARGGARSANFARCRVRGQLYGFLLWGVPVFLVDVDLLADNGNAIGRYLIEDGGDVIVESKDRVIGRETGEAERAPWLLNLLLELASHWPWSTGRWWQGGCSAEPERASRDLPPFKRLLVRRGYKSGEAGLGSEAALEEPVVGRASGEGPP